MGPMIEKLVLGVGFTVVLYRLLSLFKGFYEIQGHEISHEKVTFDLALLLHPCGYLSKFFLTGL